MYDTAIRVALVKQRVRENTRWMHLRHDTAANGHVPMTFVSFAAVAAIITLCIRLRNRENRKKGGTSKSNRNEQEEKAYEKTNTQHPAHLVYGAMPCANGGLCRGRYGSHPARCQRPKHIKDRPKQAVLCGA